MPVPEFPAGHQGILWDSEDSHIFCVWDSKNTITTYAIHDLHVDGPKVELVSVGRKPKVQTPLMLHHGFLYLQTNSGKLNRITLQSHRYKSQDGQMTENDLDAALKMRHWEAAFLICDHLGTSS